MRAGKDRYVPGADGLIAAIQDLSQARSVTEIQSIVAPAARSLTGADGATFVLRDGPFCHYIDEDAIGPLWKGQRFPLQACISGWAMLNRRSAVIPDIYADERTPPDTYRPTFVKSLVVVPIRTQQPVGAIGNYWSDRHEATETEIRMLQNLADSTSVAIENVAIHDELEDRVRSRTSELEDTNAKLQREIVERRRAEEEVRQLSLSDDLTGLYNRRGFVLLASQELKALQRSGRRGLVLYIDVDGLKQTNDTLGHDAGDRLIIGAAQVLKGAAREADVVGRLGGDEFAVFMALDADDPPIPAIVERVLDVARWSEIRISVGATASQPGRTSTLEDLLIAADEAMYRGRRARRRV